jgi:hypothetical protein
VLIVLALTAEVKIPVEEYTMDTLLGGLDLERNYVFHVAYITRFGTKCQALFWLSIFM